MPVALRRLREGIEKLRDSPTKKIMKKKRERERYLTLVL